MADEFFVRSLVLDETDPNNPVADFVCSFKVLPPYPTVDDGFGTTVTTNIDNSTGAVTYNVDLNACAIPAIPNGLNPGSVAYVACVDGATRLVPPPAGVIVTEGEGIDVIPTGGNELFLVELNLCELTTATSAQVDAANSVEVSGCIDGQNRNFVYRPDKILNLDPFFQDLHSHILNGTPTFAQPYNVNGTTVVNLAAEGIDQGQYTHAVVGVRVQGALDDMSFPTENAAIAFWIAPPIFPSRMQVLRLGNDRESNNNGNDDRQANYFEITLPIVNGNVSVSWQGAAFIESDNPGSITVWDLEFDFRITQLKVAL